MLIFEKSIYTHANNHTQIQEDNKMAILKDKDLSALVLRLFFGIAFIVAALDKILGLSMATGMFKTLFGTTAGAPLLYLTIALELAGGLMLLFDWHTREAAGVLALLMVAALISTFKIGPAANFVGTLRELLVMNTGGGNTAVNFAYFAGLLSLVFHGCRQCK